MRCGSRLLQVRAPMLTLWSWRGSKLRHTIEHSGIIYKCMYVGSIMNRATQAYTIKCHLVIPILLLGVLPRVLLLLLVLLVFPSIVSQPIVPLTVFLRVTILIVIPKVTLVASYLVLSVVLLIALLYSSHTDTIITFYLNSSILKCLLLYYYYWQSYQWNYKWKYW